MYTSQAKFFALADIDDVSERFGSLRRSPARRLAHICFVTSINGGRLDKVPATEPFTPIRWTLAALTLVGMLGVLTAMCAQLHLLRRTLRGSLVK